MEESNLFNIVGYEKDHYLITKRVFYFWLNDDQGYLNASRNMCEMTLKTI